MPGLPLSAARWYWTRSIGATIPRSAWRCMPPGAESATAIAEAISVNPDFKPAYAYRGLAFYGLEDLESARASCETKRDDVFS